MGYKANFQPLQGLIDGKWRMLSGNETDSEQLSANDQSLSNWQQSLTP
jgi:hypothetical protein